MLQVGPRAKRLWDLYGIVAKCAAAGVFISLIATVVLPLTAWICVAAFTAALVLLAVAMSRTEWFRRAAKAKAEFEKEYPSYVVHLE